jgi:hypothetical protein
MKRARACTAVYINQARESHNPGGPSNTIMVKNLDEHKDKIHELFSVGLTDSDKFETKTSWSLGEHIFGGKDYIQFSFYCYYDIVSADDVNVELLMEQAVAKLPELGLGLSHHITHYSDDISGEGILSACKKCKGLGILTQYSSYKADVEYDCPECGGYGRKLNVENDNEKADSSLA